MKSLLSSLFDNKVSVKPAYSNDLRRDITAALMSGKAANGQLDLGEYSFIFAVTGIQVAGDEKIADMEICLVSSKDASRYIVVGTASIKEGSTLTLSNIDKPFQITLS